MCLFFQAEDGIRELVRSRGLGDVYKRQVLGRQQHLERARLSRPRKRILGLRQRIARLDQRQHIHQPALQ